LTKQKIKTISETVSRFPIFSRKGNQYVVQYRTKYAVHKDFVGMILFWSVYLTSTNLFSSNKKNANHTYSWNS